MTSSLTSIVVVFVLVCLLGFTNSAEYQRNIRRAQSPVGASPSAQTPSINKPTGEEYINHDITCFHESFRPLLTLSFSSPLSFLFHLYV